MTISRQKFWHRILQVPSSLDPWEGGCRKIAEKMRVRARGKESEIRWRRLVDFLNVTMDKIDWIEEVHKIER